MADARGARNCCSTITFVGARTNRAWDRFFAQDREADHWPVKSGDLLGRPSRRHELIDKAGNYAIYGPEDIQAKLREALIAARDRVARTQHPDDGDRILGLRATAERALRMNHAEHWHPVVRRLADGRED